MSKPLYVEAILRASEEARTSRLSHGRRQAGTDNGEQAIKRLQREYRDSENHEVVMSAKVYFSTSMV